MVKNPMTVAADEGLMTAADIFLWTGVHHLPVMAAGRVVGVLSQRDLLSLQARHDGEWEDAPVEAAMRSPAETAGPDDSVSEAAARMAAHHIGCLPITELGALLGLVSTTDILIAQVRQAMQPAANFGPRVDEAMTPDPVTVHPDDHLLDAAARMRQYNVRHLPVVDGEGMLVGMLSDRDIRSAVGDPVRAFVTGETQVALESMHVEDAMSRDALSVEPDRPCAEVALYFADRRADAAPVVAPQSGKVVGVLSYVDLLRGLAAQH
jgi:CBS domain-containing protein